MIGIASKASPLQPKERRFSFWVCVLLLVPFVLTCVAWDIARDTVYNNNREKFKTLTTDSEKAL